MHGFRSWKCQKRQFLTDVSKKKRLEKCKLLLERYGDTCESAPAPVLFSDEKVFTVEQTLNSQNDRIWSVEPPQKNQRVVARAVKPKSVMVWAGVGHNLKSPLVFIPQGIKLNSLSYTKMLEQTVIPWLRRNHLSVTLQQDGAPPHRAKATQTWLRRVSGLKFISSAEWPPSSCDLSPLDYSMWGILESSACAEPHETLESLVRSLKQ